MDTPAFDELTRTLGRRGLIAAGAALLGIAWAEGESRAGGIPLCPERGEGRRCRKNRQCCSRQCKKKKGKRKGRCRCSTLREPCATDADCCGFQASNLATPRCQFQANSSTRVCCKIQPGTCQSDADCCSTAVPCTNGVCSD